MDAGAEDAHTACEPEWSGISSCANAAPAFEVRWLIRVGDGSYWQQLTPLVRSAGLEERACVLLPAAHAQAH